MDKFLYSVACFIAIVVLQSVPRFIHEINAPFPIIQRISILVLFLAGAWFFRRTLHTGWKSSVLSGMFVVESVVTVSIAVLLFLQLWSPWWAVVTGVVLLGRAAAYSYLASERITHLRGLVFFTCLFYLVAAELIVTFGIGFL